MKIIHADSRDWQQLQPLKQFFDDDDRLLYPACFGPSVFVREAGDQPYLYPADIDRFGSVRICRPGRTLPLHVPENADVAISQGYYARMILSECVRTGNLKEAGKVAEVRGEVTT